MKIVQNGDDLQGKIIKYCNITNGADLIHNVICTEDDCILMFDILNDNATLCYNEKGIKRVILTHKDIEVELLNNEVVTQSQIDKWKAEDEKKVAKLAEENKNQRYQEYLKLREEFEKLGGK